VYVRDVPNALHSQMNRLVLMILLTIKICSYSVLSGIIFVSTRMDQVKPVRVISYAERNVKIIRNARRSHSSWKLVMSTRRGGEYPAEQPNLRLGS
jgi:hypothetical protein